MVTGPGTGQPSTVTTAADAALLDAALEQFSLVGVRRTSADDIARRAGVNRATLYRRLGTKEQIVGAALLHEAGKVLAEIETAIGEVPEHGSDGSFDPVGYVVHFFTVTITALRGNRLLQQLLEVDRDETLAGLTLRAGGVLTLSSGLVADRVRALRMWQAGLPPEDADDDVEALSVTLARLAQSLLLTPDAPPLLDTPARMRRYAELVVVPMVLRTTVQTS